MGVRGADVDDNLALLVALASSELDLRGVTVTFGNTPLEVGLRSGQTTLDAARSRASLYAGARSPADLGRTTSAVDFLIDTVLSDPGNVHLLCLGPVTNVATAMQRAPEFAGALASLTLMGGAFRFPWFAQKGDPNFGWDIESAMVVLNAPTRAPSTMIAMDVCTAARFTRAEQRQLAAIESPLARHIVDGIDPWLTRHRRFGLPGFFPWDVVALAWLLAPSLFRRVDSSALRVQTSGWRAARMRRAPAAAANTREISIPQRLDGRAFMALMMERLLGIAQQLPNSHPGSEHRT